MRELRKSETMGIFIGIALVVLGSCAKVNPTAPEETVLYVSANPTTVPTGGAKSIITVIGYESTGIPLSDKTVIYFSTDIGVIDQTAKIEEGRATATFISDNRSGSAHIQVTSGKATVSPTPLEILVGSAALATLTAGANPSVLSPGGGRSIITTAAFDKSGNVLSAIPVVFSTDAGTLDSGGRVQYTDDKGEAKDNLTTSQDATVTVVSGSITNSVRISVATNSSPTAVFVYSPTSPEPGDIIYFNASSSSDSDGSIVNYAWDLGDGTTGSGEQTSHHYDAAGSYQVTLVVKDNVGASDAASQTVTVTETKNQPPTASFVYSPTSPKVADTIYFNGSLSSDSDGTIKKYIWDFGDGSSASGAKASHTYSAARSYKVTLTVSDDMGSEGSSSQTVTVSAN